MNRRDPITAAIELLRRAQLLIEAAAEDPRHRRPRTDGVDVQEAREWVMGAIEYLSPTEESNDPGNEDEAEAEAVRVGGRILNGSRLN